MSIFCGCCVDSREFSVALYDKAVLLKKLDKAQGSEPVKSKVPSEHKKYDFFEKNKKTKQNKDFVVAR